LKFYCDAYPKRCVFSYLINKFYYRDSKNREILLGVFTQELL
jgi:hypothetical protein